MFTFIVDQENTAGRFSIGTDWVHYWTDSPDGGTLSLKQRLTGDESHAYMLLTWWDKR